MARSEAGPLRWERRREVGPGDAGSGGSMKTVDAAVGPQLTKDLRGQVTELERDLLARARDVPEFADRLQAEYDAARAAERTGGGVHRVARRPGDAGGRGLGARDGVRPLLRGQRADRAGVPGRPGGAVGGGGGAPRAFFRHTRTATTGTGCSPRSSTSATPSRPPPGCSTGPQPAVGADAVVRGGHGPDRVLAHAGAVRGRTTPSTAGTPASWATSTRTCPRRPARPTRCCRPRSSSRSSSSTGPWTRRSRSSGWGPADDRPGLRVGAFPAGLFRRHPRPSGGDVRRARDDWELVSARSNGARGGHQPVRGGDRPLPAADRRAAGGAEYETARPSAGVPDQPGRRRLADTRPRCAAYQGSYSRSISSDSYATEDLNELCFPRPPARGRYHAVVGNPPYITPKDQARERGLP